MSTAVITNSFGAWIKASRPKTLGAISCPILMGSAFAIADGEFSPVFFALTFACALLLQILANVINDYGDFVRGSDSADRLGPPRAMQMGWITMPAMKMGIVLILSLIVVMGAMLCWQSGSLLLVSMGALAIALCFWYTLGKRPLAYLGFSEVMIFLVFGPGVVFGSYYAHALSWSSLALVASISPAMLSTALMLVNNLRDLYQDKRNNKKTLAVRFGEGFSRQAIVACVILAALGPVFLVTVFSFSFVALLPSITLLIPARYFSMILHEPISKRFNLMLGSIGQSLYAFGVLSILGIVYGAP